MAQFYASIQGSRGEATRLGSKASGMDAHVRGWNTGVRVAIRHVGGKDEVAVFRTGGSKARTPETLIAEWREE